MISPGGSPDADLMIIGEAPGAEELSQGVPFVGPSGRVLWSVAREQGIERTDCFITNVVQSAPSGASGNPTPAQVAAERSRLDAELSSSRARVLLLLGRFPLEQITGRRGIMEHTGYVLYPQHCLPVTQVVKVKVGEYKTSRKCPECLGPMGGGCEACGGTGYKYRAGDARFGPRRVLARPPLPPNLTAIIPCVHPAAVMRSGFLWVPFLQAALERTRRALDGKLDVIDRVPPSDGFKLDGAEHVTIDIETSGAAITRVGVASDSGHASRRWDIWSKKTLGLVLGDQSIVKCFHNAAFDLPRLKASGLKFSGRIWDTMYAAQLRQPDLPKGLRKVAPLYLDVTPWKDTSEEDPEHYNLKDAYVQHRLRARLASSLDAAGMTPTFHRIMRALPVLMAMTERGLKLDPQQLERWRASEQQKLRAALDSWPYPHVDPGSAAQVARLFYDELGLPEQRAQEKGQHRRTTNRAALYALRRRIPQLGLGAPETVVQAIDSLLTFRAASRNLTTYAEVAAAPDGCVHPSYLPTDREEVVKGRQDKGQGARTGRIQPREPNIANQPTSARKLYVPRQPGWCFAYIDWKQAEARVEAWSAQDEGLKAALDKDLHSIVAHGLGVDRTRAKNFWYGLGRFAGTRTLVNVMRDAGFEDVTQADILRWRSKVSGMFPKWWKWRLWLAQLAKSQGFITNPFGRRLEIYHSSAAPEAVGFFPQSTVGDMLLTVMPEVEALSCVFTMTLHDACLIEAHGSRIQAVAGETAGIMTQTFAEVGAGFSVPVDVKIGAPGESWGDMEERHGGNSAGNRELCEAGAGIGL